MIRAAVISYLGFVSIFVSTIVVSRLLGVEGKGIYSLFMATMGGLWIVATLGVTQGHLYHASRNPEWLRHFLANALLFSIVVGGIAGVAYFLGGRLLGFEAVETLSWPMVVAGIVGVPVGVFLTFQRQYFLALNRFELTKAIGAVSQTLPLLAYVTLYLAGRIGVTEFVIAYVATQVLCMAIFQLPARRVGPAAEGISSDLLRRAASYGYRHYASNIAVYLASRLDFFIVLYFLGERGLGIYSVAVGLSEITIRVTNEIATMLFPIFASGDLQRGQAAAALRSVTLFGIVTAAVLALISSPLVLILFGQPFAEALPVFRWLLLGTIAWTITNVTWQYVSARGRPGLGVFVFGAAVAVNILLDVLLLPRLGVVGGAVAATASYIVAALLFLRFFTHGEGCSWREALIATPADVVRLWRAARQAYGGPHVPAEVSSG
jgi:O-antigen/teichoic acid export membrane protein